MGEGHFIKSVAIRWELVHTDDYLRSNPALVTLCTLLGVVYTASEVLLDRSAGRWPAEKCAHRRVAPAAASHLTKPSPGRKSNRWPRPAAPGTIVTIPGRPRS